MVFGRGNFYAMLFEKFALVVQDIVFLTQTTEIESGVGKAIGAIAQLLRGTMKKSWQ